MKLIDKNKCWNHSTTEKHCDNENHIEKISSNKLFFGFAHRISTVEGLDKIIFLEDGRVEAVGPHDRLYASCPEYHKMVDLQKLEDEVGGGNA